MEGGAEEEEGEGGGEEEEAERDAERSLHHLAGQPDFGRRGARNGGGSRPPLVELRELGARLGRVRQSLDLGFGYGSDIINGDHPNRCGWFGYIANGVKGGERFDP